ncbi:ABC-2 transporter permease [Nonomuraea pusilla]|uniref:ABC-2 transporter permease n=1 Tax=Nonomuraea pusilla TaxID=46177 RepID=UPI003321C933
MTPLFRVIRLDLLTLKPYRRPLGLMAAVGVAVCAYAGEPATVSALLLAYLLLAFGYPFAIIDRFGLETLYATLGLRRRDLVAARYVAAGGAVALTAAAGLPGGALLAAATGRAFDLGGALTATAAAVAAVAVVLGVQIPLYLKVGYLRARALAFLPFLLPIGAALLVPHLPERALEAVASVASAHPQALTAALLAAAPVALAVSYAVSLRIYDAKDL